MNRCLLPLVALLVAATPSHADDWRELYEDAAQAQVQRKYKEARRLLEQALELAAEFDPTDWRYPATVAELRLPSAPSRPSKPPATAPVPTPARAEPDNPVTMVAVGSGSEAPVIIPKAFHISRRSTRSSICELSCRCACAVGGPELG